MRYVIQFEIIPVPILSGQIENINKKTILPENIYTLILDLFFQQFSVTPFTDHLHSRRGLDTILPHDVTPIV